MSPIKIARRNRIFSPLCPNKLAMHNKRKGNNSRMCHFNNELLAGFLENFYYALVIIMDIQVAH